jgi:hypothetical protein
MFSGVDFDNGIESFRERAFGRRSESLSLPKLV